MCLWLKYCLVFTRNCRRNNDKVEPTISDIMHHCSTLAIVLAILITIAMADISEETTMKSIQTNNFNVLLNLCKVNPLRTSEVFRKLSNRLLLPNKERKVLNFDSNESAKSRKSVVTLNTKQIEDIIYAIKAPQGELREPDYNIENVSTEKVSVHLLQRKPHQKDQSNRNIHFSKKGQNVFSSIFNYLGSVDPNHDNKGKLVTVKTDDNNTESDVKADAALESNLIHEPDHDISEGNKFKGRPKDEGIVVFR